jgi:hypothetical protein
MNCSLATQLFLTPCGVPVGFGSGSRVSGWEGRIRNRVGAPRRELSKLHQPRHLQREVVCCEKLLMSYDSDPDCHVRGLRLTEVWVGSVLREGPCGELAPIAPAYHRPRSGGGAGTPIRPTRGAARPPPPPTAMCGPGA